MRSERGFTYLGVLVAVALLGIALAATSEVWVMVARRERLAQLEWAGQQFMQAIGSYYESSPGSVKVYPRSMQDLLDDRRFLTLRRHIRQLYRNPFDARGAWELVPGTSGGIRGVQARVPSAEDQERTEMRQFVYVPTAP